jgi:hypothetical protein
MRLPPPRRGRSRSPSGSASTPPGGLVDLVERRVGRQVHRLRRYTSCLADRLVRGRQNLRMDAVSFDDLPGRIFLDTCTLNFALDHSEEIFEAAPSPPDLNERAGRDVNALRGLFQTGQRASWQLAVSDLSLAEIGATADPTRRQHLANWLADVSSYWQAIAANQREFISAASSRATSATILRSGHLDYLPDAADRSLLADALAFGCDCFCTRDWRTMLRRRRSLSRLPIDILTPNEWWERVRPYAALWY